MAVTQAYGAQRMTATLRRVLLRPPQEADVQSWRELGWRAAPDFARLSAEHDAFCTLLSDAGAEVLLSDGSAGNLDAIYTFDPVLATNEGALLLQPGKPQRRNEPEQLVPALDRAGLPIRGRLSDQSSPREVTRSGWTRRRSSSATRIARTQPASTHCVVRYPASTCAHSIFRICAEAARSSTSCRF